MLINEHHVFTQFVHQNSCVPSLTTVGPAALTLDVFESPLALLLLFPLGQPLPVGLRHELLLVGELVSLLLPLQLDLTLQAAILLATTLLCRLEQLRHVARLQRDTGTQLAVTTASSVLRRNSLCTGRRWTD